MHAAFGATGPFHVAKVGDVSYRVANDGFRADFIDAMASRSTQGRRVYSDPIGNGEEGQSESVQLALGLKRDGAEWIESRRRAGFGIVIIPPPGWKPDNDPLHISWGAFTAIATESFVPVHNHAAVGASGFVLVEPAQGWLGADVVTSSELPSTESLLVAAGVAVGVAAVVYLLWGRV